MGNEGLIRKPFSRLAYALAATLTLIGLMVVTAPRAGAVEGAHTFEFTQDELDTNWSADRTFPTGGVSSVTAFGRDNVAQLSIDSESASETQFYRTEGIKTTGDFGDGVQADLYIDEIWQVVPVRAGLWADGANDQPQTDGPWGILEFTTNNIGTNGYNGWRAWTSDVGWTELADVDFTFNQWSTAKIELDEANQQFKFYVNGELVHTGNAPSDNGNVTHLGAVVLNSYNYGQDGAPSYQVHWHGGIEEEPEPTDPSSKDECKKGGWEAFGFRNQGLCIQFVNTGKDSRQ